MTIQILAAFLSHGIFFRFPKISKTNQSHSNINQIQPTKCLNWKSIIGLIPCMVPHVYGQTERTSVCVCVLWLWVYLHIYSYMCCLCMLLLHISVCSWYSCVTKDLPSVCVFVCVLDAVGEQGGAKDPDVVASALLQHMVMGARGSTHHQECLGIFSVCAHVYMCVCMCTVWFLIGRCGHTDHYVFVCHDDGLGIFPPDTRNSCPANLQWYTAFTINLSGNVSLFHCMHMYFSLYVNVFLWCFYSKCFIYLHHPASVLSVYTHQKVLRMYKWTINIDNTINARHLHLCPYTCGGTI